MPSVPAGYTVTQTELCQLFGVTPPTIRQWERQGCPVVQKGGRGRAAKYAPRDVIRWREEQARLAAAGDLAAMDLDEAKRRKLAAEAASAELALDQQRGAVVAIDDVTSEVGKCLDACRARLLGIGAKVAPIVAIEAEVATCKSIIDQAVSEALDELAGSSYGGEPSEFAEGSSRAGRVSDESAADANALGVG